MLASRRHVIGLHVSLSQKHDCLDGWNRGLVTNLAETILPPRQLLSFVYSPSTIPQSRQHAERDSARGRPCGKHENHPQTQDSHQVQKRLWQLQTPAGQGTMCLAANTQQSTEPGSVMRTDPNVNAAPTLVSLAAVCHSDMLLCLLLLTGLKPYYALHELIRHLHGR